MGWRADRLDGKSPELKAPKPVTRKRTKPAITSKPGEAAPVPGPQAEGRTEAQPEAT